MKAVTSCDEFTAELYFAKSFAQEMKMMLQVGHSCRFCFQPSWEILFGKIRTELGVVLSALEYIPSFYYEKVLSY